MEVLIAVLVGCICGWFTGVVIKGKGASLLFNLLIGIVGGFLGELVFEHIDTELNWFWESAIAGILGASVLLALWTVIRSQWQKRRLRKKLKP